MVQVPGHENRAAVAAAAERIQKIQEAIWSNLGMPQNDHPSKWMVYLSGFWIGTQRVHLIGWNNHEWFGHDWICIPYMSMIIEYCILCLCISTELGYNGVWTDKHELGDINCWGLGSLCASRPKMATSRLRCRRNTSPRTWCAGSMSHAILGLIQSTSLNQVGASKSSIISISKHDMGIAQDC